MKKLEAIIKDLKRSLESVKQYPEGGVITMPPQDAQTLLNAIEERWIPVDKDNLPEGEVLAYGYQGEMLLGPIYYELDGVFCENDSEILTDVTHYRIPTPPKG